MEILFPALLVCLSYLVGGIPFGLLLAHRRGVDIRTRGSRNIGATNVTRVLGKKLGVLTLVLDVGKGYVPICLAGRLLRDSPDVGTVAALCGAAAILGHMFPVYLRFRGGKGVATGLGVFLYLAPLAVVGCLAVFLVAVGLSGFVSLGSLLGSASMVLWLFFLDEPGWKLALAAFVVVMIWFKHRQNIGRLLRGEEQSWKRDRSGETA
ncbi:MAG: glycerol-3-phosphate 1-O-acyltransferase PlsY [Desulfobulbus sp.]|jgi:glycerol-3-phosphate acyltransferase PlsY